MLLRNGEPVNLNLKESDLDQTTKWVRDEISAIASTKRPYVIKSKMRLRPLMDDQGFPHIDQRNVAVPTTTTFINPFTNISENWQYLENGSQYKRLPNGDTSIIKTPALVVSTSGTVRGNVLQAPKDAEMIFFLTKISATMIKGKIYLEDKAKEAKLLSDQMMTEFEAKNLIMDVKSPISVESSGDESLMKQIALAWNVAGADAITYSEVKLLLLKSLEASQRDYVRTRRGYQEFINDVHRISDVEKRSTITLAIERGILLFEDNIWNLRTREGGLQFLLSIPPEQVDQRENFIIRHLTRKENDSFYNTIESMISDPSSKDLLTLPPLERWSKADLLKYTKEELDWPHKIVFSKSKDDLLNIVKNKEVYKE